MEFPERFDDIDIEWIKGEFRPCMKKPIEIKAMEMDRDFRVKTIEGDYKQGKAGDYLMCGIDGELYIYDKNIFERSYDFTHR